MLSTYYVHCIYIYIILIGTHMCMYVYICTHIARVITFSWINMCILSQHTWHTNVQILSVQNELKEVLDQRIAEVMNSTETSGVSEELMLQTMESQIQQHLDVAKEQWLKQVSVNSLFTYVYIYTYCIIIYVS